MFELSIVIPTRNRADALLKALMGIERTTHSTYEVIVVDGASTDATNGVLMLASSIMGSRLRVIREAAGVGFGAACSKGIAIARGRNVAVLHDDVHPLDGALDAAIEQLDQDGGVGILALLAEATPATEPAVTRVIDGVRYSASHARGTLVAEFPIARRQTFLALGFDDALKTTAATVDFSLRAWATGHTVSAALASPLASHREAAKVDRKEVESVIKTAGLPMAGTEFDPKKPCTMLPELGRQVA